MEVYHVRPGNVLLLGKQGENFAKQIQFDLSRWISNFGPGTVQLLHQRNGDEAPYPVAVEQEGDCAVWTVTSADTAAAGTGRAELQYYVGDALAKSETWMTKALPALGPASETPPEAQQGWVDQVLQAGTVATEAADRAEEAAVRQPYPNAETGTWWVWNAESGAYEDTGISYGTGGSGGGVTDHEKLTGRDKADQHPMIAITGLEDALAGKQPTGTYLTEETDPTVHAWAKEEKKPSYTADEVGADPSGTASSQVSAHNTETTAHSDIRLLIQGLTERLNTLADSDDTTLDQLSEVVSYIKSNRSLIEAITTSKVSVADIIDNLTTNVSDKPLSAAQGVALKALIDAITIPTALPNPNALTFTGAVSGSYDGSAPVSVEIPSGVSEVQSGFELIDSIDWSTEDMAQAGAAKEYTLNGVTEIIIVWQGMANGTQTTSSLGVQLNGLAFSGSGTVPTSKAGSKLNGFSYYRCFEGVGTLVIKSPGANSVNTVATNAQIPYSLLSITEKITKLRISNNGGYVANTGITKIYVR